VRPVISARRSPTIDGSGAISRSPSRCLTRRRGRAKMPGDASFSARRTGADRARPHRRGDHGHHPAPRATSSSTSSDVQGAGERQRARVARQPVSWPISAGCGSTSAPTSEQPSSSSGARGRRDEALLFKHAGGQTFVDPTNRGCPRSAHPRTGGPRQPGSNIIMGSVTDVDAAHHRTWGPRTADEVAARSWPNSRLGVDETGVRAGFHRRDRHHVARIGQRGKKVVRRRGRPAREGPPS